MIIEIATLYVKQGLEESFETDFELARQYISAIKGYLSHTLLKCIEVESKYILTVNWENLEDHTVGFIILTIKIFLTINWKYLCMKYNSNSLLLQFKFDLQKTKI